MSNIYLVTVEHVEGTQNISAHRTRRGALRSWNRQRRRLLRDYRSMLRQYPGSEHYRECIANMLCRDPEKIANSVHDCPFIRKMKMKT